MDLEPFDRVLAAARAGEGWALAEVFRDLHPRIRRYLKSLAPHLADDVASDTWLDLVRALDRFRGGVGDLRALAFSIARTRLNEMRASGAGDQVDVEAVAAMPSIRTPMPAPAADLDPALSALDTDAALERILTLPTEQAEVILLRILGGLTIDEVSRTIGTSARAVRALESDALRELALSTARDRSVTT
ncbi:MAG TPA: RNA polymerase sigma factor [Actinomycetota bacterium]|nr:RNA polymerase sigma factor [Actinomycetota bacterium]